MLNIKKIYILLLLAPLLCSAQRRQIGDARTILKSGKNYDKAEKLMTDLLKDSSNLENKRIYDIWLQSVEGQYDQQNEKMYKKQPVDTAQFFNLTKRLFVIAERLDSIDMKPDKKGRVDLDYRKENAKRLMEYRPNLFFGGSFHLRKGNFNQAYDFYEMYIDCARQPLFSEQDLSNTDARLSEAAYWASYSGYRLQDPVLTLRYFELARNDSSKLDFTLLYAAESWHQLNDEAQYVQILWDGFRLFPTSSYFFPRLMDNYTAKGNYRQALSVAEEALQTDSLNELFLFAKSTMLLNLGRNQQSLEYSKMLLKVNAQMVDAYYNAGTACLNMILDMDARKQRKQVRQLYQQAQSYMEVYRRLAPDATDKWGPALYRIYFNLNMGKQFDEIDEILKKQKS